MPHAPLSHSASLAQTIPPASPPATGPRQRSTIAPNGLAGLSSGAHTDKPPSGLQSSSLAQPDPAHSLGMANLSSMVPGTPSNPRLTRYVVGRQRSGKLPPSTAQVSPSRQGVAHVPPRRTPRESSSTQLALRHWPPKEHVAPAGSRPEEGLQVVVNRGVEADAWTRTRQVSPAS